MRLIRLLAIAALAASAALGLRAYVVEGIYIASSSMEPTLPVGIHLFLDKITFRFRDPRRGDIICFRPPVPPDEGTVKRVIAVGGDTVEIRERKVYVNGALLDEPYVQFARASENLEGDNLAPLKVPPGYLFVLGDNRDWSDDSRIWRDKKTGAHVYFVPLSSVRGIVRGFY